MVGDGSASRCIGADLSKGPGILSDVSATGLALCQRHAAQPPLLTKGDQILGACYACRVIREKQAEDIANILGNT